MTNLFGYIKGYPEEGSEAAIRRFISSLTESRTVALSDERIVAVVRTREYVSQAQSMGMDILSEPLGADLMTVFMVDRPDSMSPLSRNDLPGRDLASVRKLALDNVRKWLPKVVTDDQLGDVVLFYVEENTMLSTTLILLDEFWQSNSARFPGEVLLALPRRDQLFVIDGRSPTARARARRLITATFEDDFNLLSPNLYAWRDGKVVLVTD